MGEPQRQVCKKNRLQAVSSRSSRSQDPVPLTLLPQGSFGSRRPGTYWPASCGALRDRHQGSQRSRHAFSPTFSKMNVFRRGLDASRPMLGPNYAHGAWSALCQDCLGSNTADA